MRWRLCRTGCQAKREGYADNQAVPVGVAGLGKELHAGGGNHCKYNHGTAANHAVGNGGQHSAYLGTETGQEQDSAATRITKREHTLVRATIPEFWL